MKTPTPDQLRLAADWCDGDESSDLKTVVAWLKTQADAAEARIQARKIGVSVNSVRLVFSKPQNT